MICAPLRRCCSRSPVADDAAVLGKHGAQLQDIDIAMRFVSSIAARLAKCEPESARFKLDGLRSSALQALGTYG